MRKLIRAFIFFCLCFCHLVGVFVAETNREKTLSVKEEDSVTLDSGVTDIHNYNDMEWRYGNLLIARIKRAAFNTSCSVDRRFIHRLQLDNQTGSLTITNTRPEHTGVYKLTIMDEKKGFSTEIFNVTVYVLPPIPVIFSDTSQCSSSERSSLSNCLLLCSVLNVSHVTLSWYKGNSLLSNISVSDLSISLFLPLEVGYQDKNTYSCVVNNPVSHQTRHLDIDQLCWTSSDYYHSYGRTEAVIRLVVTALMGVAAAAAVVVLVYDIRYRKTEQNRRSQKLASNVAESDIVMEE